MAVSPLDAARRLRDAAVRRVAAAIPLTLSYYRRYLQQAAEFVSRVG